MGAPETTAHAVRRETRVIDEQAFALIDLVAKIESCYDGPELTAARDRLTVILARTAVVRERVEFDWLCPRS